MKLKHVLCFTLFSFCCTPDASSQNDQGVAKELLKLKFPLAELEWEKPVSQKGVFL